MNRTLNAGLMLAAAISASPAMAHNEDMPVTRGAELSAWCKDTAYQYFLQSTDEIYNWRHTTLRKGNLFRVEGRWRVDGDDVEVECTIRAGAEQRFATFRVVGSR